MKKLLSSFAVLAYLISNVASSTPRQYLVEYEAGEREAILKQVSALEMLVDDSLDSYGVLVLSIDSSAAVTPSFVADDGVFRDASDSASVLLEMLPGVTAVSADHPRFPATQLAQSSTDETDKFIEKKNSGLRRSSPGRIADKASLNNVTSKENPTVVNDHTSAAGTPSGIVVNEHPFTGPEERVTVCIVDSGVDRSHVLPNDPGYTGSSTNTDAEWDKDILGHGTHILTLVESAVHHNEPASPILSPNANHQSETGPVDYHVVRVFEGRPWTTVSKLLLGLDQCWKRSQDTKTKLIVNLSLGGSMGSAVEQNFLRKLKAKGVIMVAAAGNNYHGEFYPASYDSVVSVAAVDSSRNVAAFSQTNGNVDLAAYGVRVPVTKRARANQTPTTLSGTSVAAARVSGFAARLWAQFPRCSASTIVLAFTGSALDLGPQGRDSQYGYGVVNQSEAAEWLRSSSFPCAR